MIIIVDICLMKLYHAQESVCLLFAVKEVYLTFKKVGILIFMNFYIRLYTEYVLCEN